MESYRPASVVGPGWLVRRSSRFEDPGADPRTGDGPRGPGTGPRDLGGAPIRPKTSSIGFSAAPPETPRAPAARESSTFIIFAMSILVFLVGPSADRGRSAQGPRNRPQAIRTGYSIPRTGPRSAWDGDPNRSFGQGLLDVLAGQLPRPGDPRRSAQRLGDGRGNLGQVPCRGAVRSQ